MFNREAQMTGGFIRLPDAVLLRSSGRQDQPGGSEKLAKLKPQELNCGTGTLFAKRLLYFCSAFSATSMRLMFVSC